MVGDHLKIRAHYTVLHMEGHLSRLDMLASRWIWAIQTYFTTGPFSSISPIIHLLFIALIDKITALACSIISFAYSFFCIFSRTIPLAQFHFSLVFFHWLYFVFGFGFICYSCFIRGHTAICLCNCSFIWHLLFLSWLELSIISFLLVISLVEVASLVYYNDLYRMVVIKGLGAREWYTLERAWEEHFACV